jgi:hypothetical protein
MIDLHRQPPQVSLPDDLVPNADGYTNLSEQGPHD